jgi:hypothetical protein
VLALILCLSVSAWAEDEDPSPAEFPRMSLDQDPKPPPAPAKEEPQLPWRTFELLTGVSYSSLSSTIVVSRAGGGAAFSIDAEGTLGLSHEVLSPEVWTAFRLGERHRISFGFDDMTRSATRTLQRDIEINGTTYPIGTSVHSVYGVQFFNLAWAWSFLQDERIEMALTLAFDTLRAHFAFEPDNGQVSANERFFFPIPLPGLNADFVLIKDLWLRERLQWMYVPIQSYSGLMINFNVALEYSVLKNVALGVGFDLQRIELEKTSSGSTWGNFEGKFDFNSGGVLVYINFHL